MENFILPTKNTWCPGCGNFIIQKSIETVVGNLKKENLVLVTGIGCHGKMADYLNINSFYSLHGRAIPTATGIKIANSNLDVICCVGDGDTYNEGIAHLIHAARRNVNITVIVHDNHVFSLTVKQATATSPKGFIGTSTPKGSPDDPINPLLMMLSVNASFVARGYTGKGEHLSQIILEGVRHNGFSFIEVLQPCVAWHNTYPDYNERTYEIEEKDLTLEEGIKRAKEWDYSNSNKIPLGVFYKQEKPTLDSQLGDIFKPDMNSFLESNK